MSICRPASQSALCAVTLLEVARQGKKTLANTSAHSGARARARQQVADEHAAPPRRQPGHARVAGQAQLGQAWRQRERPQVGQAGDGRALRVQAHQARRRHQRGQRVVAAGQVRERGARAQRLQRLPRPRKDEK